MTCVQGTAGLCVVRDAADIVGFLCGHYLRAGFELLHFIDDGSSDGTYEFLEELSRRTSRVSVQRNRSSAFLQPELMTDAANILIDRGFELILPFDADEFWDIDEADLEHAVSTPVELLIVGKWLQFVQERSVEEPSASALTRARFRAPVQADADRDAIRAFRRSFVCSSDRKVGFKTRAHIQLARGQHFLAAEPAATYAREFEIFHLPFRSRAEIGKRACDYEPRRALVRTNASDSWQSAFHREVFLAGRSAELWAANSADDSGHLQCDGERIKLEEDDRLQRLLLRAAAYLEQCGLSAA